MGKFFTNAQFLLQTTLIDELESCGLLEEYCDVFISHLDSHSDGTHSLQMIHWWASDLLLNFSKSVQIFWKIQFLGELYVLQQHVTDDKFVSMLDLWPL